MRTYKKALLLSVALLSLSSCGGASLQGRHNLAKDIASKAQMQESTIQAFPFTITSFQKMHRPGHASARVYIEGDGLAWLSKTQASLNPTPTDPFALKLAARDPSPNVIYLARPCQFSGRIDGQLCEPKYWRSARYAPEVLRSYNDALNTLKIRYSIHHLELIGYSGGGTLAALLAGNRNDVTSLRTVAGNLDHKEHSQVHGVSILRESLNPPDYSAKLQSIPQYHFIGGDDSVVPMNIYQKYTARFADKSCVNYKTLPGYSHDSAQWHENWQTLLSYTPSCQ